MRVDAGPARTPVTPGQPVVVTVTVFNSGDVIAAYRVDVLGVDPRWASTDVDTLQLFPGSSGTVVVTVTLPEGIPAGTRNLGLQVTELTPPGDVEVAEVELLVVAEAAAALALEPLSVTGGRSTEVGLTVRNEGNTVLDLVLAGNDPEGGTRFEFQPPSLRLEPGEEVAVSTRLSARRPLLGTPKVRAFDVTAVGCDPAPQAFGTFVQRPFLSRGAVTLLGLLAAVTVFAAVITGALSRIVDRSEKDRALLLEVMQGGDAGRAQPAGSIAGHVTQLSTAAPISGVTVEAFAVDRPAEPVASAATGSDGGFLLDGIAEGNFTVRFRGAGFVEIWYPLALVQAEATEVEVGSGEAVTGIDVRLGGVPGTIRGTVVGEDEPTGAQVALQVPDTAGDAAGAVVASTVVDATGAFVLEAVPSPATYQLVLTKDGYGRSSQLVNLAAGEERRGIELVLLRGDGTVSGAVTDGANRLGGVTIVATSGTATSETVSLTQDDVGGYTLRDLPTPGAYTITFAKDGYATESVQVGLAAGEERIGVDVALRRGAGSISGTTRVDGTVAGGVTVTVTDGERTVSASSVSVGAVGSYLVSGLPVPGTYTVTFSRPDLQSQTRLVDLDGGARRDVAGVDVALRRSTATVAGSVVELGTGAPIGGAAVSLTSGDRAYNSRSADAGGQFEVGGIVPGTYTLTVSRSGSQAASRLVTLAAGQVLDTGAVALEPRASIRGQTINQGTGAALAGAQIRLYLAADYPNTLVATVTSDASGQFSFPDLDAPVTYIVELYFPENTPRRSITVPLDGGEQVDLGGVALETT
ncbi:MAG: carboxypeptidase regulatory-like domain-containing protein [Acidimicrobiia bacterium]